MMKKMEQRAEEIFFFCQNSPLDISATTLLELVQARYRKDLESTRANDFGFGHCDPIEQIQSDKTSP